MLLAAVLFLFSILNSQGVNMASQVSGVPEGTTVHPIAGAQTPTDNLPPATTVHPIIHARTYQPAEAPDIQAPQTLPDSLPVDTSKITRSGAIEYSPAFRQKLADAVQQAKLKGDAAESGFWVGASGGMSPTDTEQGREVSINPSPTAKLMAHTHPTNKGAQNILATMTWSKQRNAEYRLSLPVTEAFTRLTPRARQPRLRAARIGKTQRSI
jgi:hypothetical protein